MSIFIKGVRTEPVGNNDHVHITMLRYNEIGNPTLRDVSKNGLIEWLNGNSNNQAFVKVGQNQVRVYVVPVQPPYVRTVADGIWTDNLLSLPRF